MPSYERYLMSSIKKMGLKLDGVIPLIPCIIKEPQIGCGSVVLHNYS